MVDFFDWSGRVVGFEAESQFWESEAMKMRGGRQQCRGSVDCPRKLERGVASGEWEPQEDSADWDYVWSPMATWYPWKSFEKLLHTGGSNRLLIRIAPA
jgi:hypothetical protein